MAGTLALCALVGAAAAVVGAGTASLVALADFPGRRLLSVALILPFAVPAYISAYAYADFLGPFGGLARLLGEETWRKLPSIRSMGGAALVLALSSYAYVYLAMRASLAARSAAFLEAARTLGAKPANAVRLALLPAGRGALAGGLALALMETVADYGVADYFGVQTLSVGIFRTWYGLGDLAAASQIAASLFLFALALILLEQFARKGRGSESARAARRSARIKLNGVAATAAAIFCALPPALGFFLPVGVLLAKIAETSGLRTDAFAQAASNTTLLAAVVGVAASVIAIALAYAARRGASAALIRIATLGYALPGAMLAIGVLAAASMLRDGAGLAPSGLALLAFAMTLRFLTAGYNSVAGGFAQIHPLTDDAARMLGATPMGVAHRIHLPLGKGSIIAGLIIVFIDVAKELPATLLLRPFNFETLATRVYRLASDERFAESAPAALLLIAVSLAPVIWLEIVSSARGRHSD